LTVVVASEHNSLICPTLSSSTTAGSCYAVSVNPGTWANENIKATSHGGLLASISSAAEQTNVTSGFAAILSTQDLWFGLHDAGVEDTWIWSDYSPSPAGSTTAGTGYANWGGGQPDNAGNEDCAGFFPVGTWNDFPCSFSRRSIVEYPMTLSSYLSGLTVFNGHRYARTSVPMNWAHANALANMLGGHLVKIEDAAEQAFLEAAYPVATAAFWIGLNDLANEGSFRWTDGTTPGFTAWSPGEPNNAGNENCTHMNSSGKWNDAACDRTSIGTPVYALIEWDSFK
jgi:hypothetical protein